MKKIFFVLRIFICFALLSVNSSAQIINTIAGTGTAGYSGDGGLATSAGIWHAWQVFVDASGNVLIGDGGNNRIRKIDVNGMISTIAGNGTASYSGDGVLATNAELHSPDGVFADNSGNVYIGDYTNHRVRKVSASTGIISTIAGTGTIGNSGDGGAATAAQLNTPTAVFVDAVGNVYIADEWNHNVRKITASTGIISTIAGTGTLGYSGDGGLATSAQLNRVQMVFPHASGNIYIADGSNNRIRKIDGNGIISTIAGTGSVGYSGDGAAAINAQLNSPYGVFVDASGIVYISDGENNRIRKIDLNGIITTISGTGTAGYSGDGGIATSAQLNGPAGIFVDSFDNVYFSEYNNNIIRKITVTGTGMADVSNDKTISIYPNPTTGKITMSCKTSLSTLEIYNLLGEKIFAIANFNTKIINEIDLSKNSKGIYLVKIYDGEKIQTEKMVIE